MKVGRWCALSKPPILMFSVSTANAMSTARCTRASFIKLCVLLQSPTSCIVEFVCRSAVAQAGDFDVLHQHDQRHELSERCRLSVNFLHYCTNLCSTPECAEKVQQRSTKVGEKTKIRPLRTSSRRETCQPHAKRKKPSELRNFRPVDPRAMKAWRKSRQAPTPRQAQGPKDLDSLTAPSVTKCRLRTPTSKGTEDRVPQ